ncbi:hypothetical protein HZH66_010168 [Vespula vulgaris]|uniref:Uncharacterized protein n=1 Tax=Vespula vulgaris TaxID=7454 RepID=A0A834JIE2_VESVU|nr:hypothetical protein HZH66_010168 [Vespula vulgaris]
MGNSDNRYICYLRVARTCMESFGGENNDVEIPSVVILPGVHSAQYIWRTTYSIMQLISQSRLTRLHMNQEKSLGPVLKKSPISISSNPKSVEHANEEKRNIVQAC